MAKGACGERGAEVRRARILADGLGFTEGPVLLRNGTVAVTSLSHGCVYLIEPGGPRVLVETEAAANGAAEGPDGALYIAHFWGAPPAKAGPPSTGGILRAHSSGALEWLTRDPISPNDLCFGPDAYLYVTDPTRPHRQDGRLWRCDVADGRAELLVSVPWHPNGIAFGPDDDRLFVASTHDGRIMVFPFRAGGPLGDPQVFCHLPCGRPDGLAFDVEGNLLVAAPADSPEEQSFVHVFDPRGRHIEAYAPVVSHRFSNVALGPDRVLIVTDVAHESVLAVDNWPWAGLALHPFR